MNLLDVVGMISKVDEKLAAMLHKSALMSGSNFYSLLLGIGVLLFMQRLKDCLFGLVFGGSEDHHIVIESLGWTYFPAISRFYLNWSYPTFSGEPLWRKLAKGVFRYGSRRKLGSYAPRLNAA
jgi:hypothetical protein